MYHHHMSQKGQVNKLLKNGFATTAAKTDQCNSDTDSTAL